MGYRLRFCVVCGMYVIPATDSLRCPVCLGRTISAAEVSPDYSKESKMEGLSNKLARLLDGVLRRCRKKKEGDRSRKKLELLKELFKDELEYKRKNMKLSGPNFILLNEFLRYLGIYIGYFGGLGYMFLMDNGDLWGAGDILAFQPSLGAAVQNMCCGLILREEPITENTIKALEMLKYCCEQVEKMGKHKASKLVSTIDKCISVCEEAQCEKDSK